MTADQLVLLLAAYGAVVTVLLVLALGGNSDVVAENRRLRRDYLRHIGHPAGRDPR